MPVLVDFLSVSTRDGYRLDGMFQAAVAENRLDLDAVCFIHGTGGNFYSSPYSRLLPKSS
jgi:hypothetical protein